MDALGSVAMVLLQDDMAAMQHDIHLQTIFMGIIAIVMLVSIVVVCIGGLVGLRLMRKGEEMAETMGGKIVPLVDKSNELVNTIGPKMHTICENVEQMSYTIRGKVDELSDTVSELNKTVKDANSRTRSQVQRVDGMVTEALGTAQEVSHTVQENIKRPVQQIAGIIAGFRAGLETLAERSPFFRRGRQSRDECEAPNPYDM